MNPKGIAAIMVGIGLIVAVLLFFASSEEAVRQEKLEISTVTVAEKERGQRHTPKPEQGSAPKPELGSIPADALPKASQTAPKRRLISDQGVLPSGLATEMGLSVEQRNEVQQEISRFWKTMAASVASRAVFDENASDLPNKIDVYHIAAIEDRGRALKEEFRRSLAGIAGESVAEQLSSNLQMQLFGGFGSCDVTLTFMPDQDFINAGRGEDSTKVRYLYTNPDTGAGILTGEASWEGFSERFGNWGIKNDR